MLRDPLIVASLLLAVLSPLADADPVGHAATDGRALGLWGDGSCVRAEEGSVWCWGAYTMNVNHGRPRLKLGPGASAVSGSLLTCGVYPTATVACATIATATHHVLPRDVINISGAALESCVRLAEGSVWCRNYQTQFARVDGVDDATGVAIGTWAKCVVHASGGASCWGENARGELGDGTTTPRAAPTPVVGLTDATTVARGSRHTCAATEDGAAWCWGWNHLGQLGDGTQEDRLVRVAVAGLPRVAGLALGGAHSCALDGSGGVWCWGANDRGQLGDGTVLSRATPARAALPTPAVEVAAGSSHTCAIDAAGAVWCWGSNANAQLGGLGVTACPPQPLWWPIVPCITDDAVPFRALPAPVVWVRN